MNDVSIVTKTWLLMGLLVVGLAGLVGVAKWSGQAVDQANVELTTRVLPFQRNAMELHLGVMQLQLSLKNVSGMRGQDVQDAGLIKADAMYTIASKQIDAMLAIDPEHAQEYRDLHTRLDSFYLTGKTMTQTYAEQGADIGSVSMLKFDAAANELLREVGELWERAVHEEDEMLAAQLAIVHAGSNKVLFTSLLIGVVMLAGLMLLNRTVKPLADLTTAALRIAGNDLSSKVSQLDRADEVGRLSAAVSSMQDKLVQRVQEIAAVTEQVRHAVATLNAVSDQASSGVEQQRSETQQVATAMNEMTATVHEVARNTAAAAEAASHADDEVGGGSKVVKQTMASINKLADEVRKGAEVITRLEQDSNNIGAVLDVIKAIAEQTNLLALNAAIEAARAGEQGRGFAVVADEVRTLAQRTQESTREIQQMIEKLQQGAQEAVRVMHEGRSQAEASVSQAGQAGQSLDTIRSAVSTIHDMTTQIASAAEEQSAVAEEINRNIVNISHVVDQTASGMQKTAGASDELTRLAEQLQAVVLRFKLPA